MIVALLMVVAILLFASLLPRTQRVLIPVTIQKGWWLATLCGIANGATNLLVMHLVAEGFPASVLFPVVSGADLLLIFLFSVLVKRERYTLPQYIGYGLGVVSLVLLNM
jgi:uncharacterized membrane protein